MRIARVKFPISEEIEEYICQDKTIEEGDVVFLEDYDGPIHVYEIEDVDPKSCDSKKSVISKAEINSKVTLSSKYMDITKADTECIVNSLGTNLQSLGQICRSIMLASKSQELRDFINSKEEAKVFEIVVTGAGELPTKHIINIVMPYKYFDKNNEQLKKAFSLVIDKAIELKYKSIAIPYIGAGANGYKYEDIHRALNDVMFNYQYKKDIAIDILSVRYFARNRSMENELEDINIRMIRRLQENSSERERMFNQLGLTDITQEEFENRIADYLDTNPNELFVNYLNTNQARYSKKEFKYSTKDGIKNVNLIQDTIRRNYRVQDELVFKDLYSPADFIRAAIKKAGGYDEVRNLPNVLSESAIKNIARFSKHIKKEQLYASAVILKLNFTQVIQYMEISGFTFSPATKCDLDLKVFKYIVENDGFTQSQEDIDTYFSQFEEYVREKVIDYEAPKRADKQNARISA